MEWQSPQLHINTHTPSAEDIRPITYALELCGRWRWKGEWHLDWIIEWQMCITLLFAYKVVVFSTWITGWIECGLFEGYFAVKKLVINCLLGNQFAKKAQLSSQLSQFVVSTRQYTIKGQLSGFFQKAISPILVPNGQTKLPVLFRSRFRILIV